MRKLDKGEWATLNGFVCIIFVVGALLAISRSNDEAVHSSVTVESVGNFVSSDFVLKNTSNVVTTKGTFYILYGPASAVKGDAVTLKTNGARYICVHDAEYVVR